jgi:hypothetical protein
LKFRINSEKGKGDNFTLETRKSDLEQTFIEIDKLLFNHDEKASKKEVEHKPGNICFSDCIDVKDVKDAKASESVTKPAHKIKMDYIGRTLETPRNHGPTFVYVLSHENMTNLISKTAQMTKKNFENINLILEGQKVTDDIE